MTTDPTAQLKPDRGRRYRLEIQGRLPLFWAANLAAGLATRGISIVSGRAVRQHLDWTAAFVIDATHATTDLDRLDCVRLAQTDCVVTGTAEVQLTRFTCTRLDAGLEVRLYGPDQGGFLAKMLRKMALLTLFPVQFEIATPAGRIEDVFMLSGVGGSAPTENARAAFEKMLTACVA